MMTRRAIGLTMVLAALAGLLIGCGRSSLRIGWLGAGGPGHRTARYRTFSGVERATFRVKAGQAVTIDYEVLVRKETLTLSLIDPDGETVWEETFDEAEEESGEAEISHSGDYELAPAPQGGRYKLRIEGDRTGGSYDVSWSVEDR